MSSPSAQRLVERFKSSFQISNNWVFKKDVASKYSLRLPQLEYTRFPPVVVNQRFLTHIRIVRLYTQAVNEERTFGMFH